MTPAYARPGKPRWVGEGNFTVLAFADDRFAASVSSWLAGTANAQMSFPDSAYWRGEALVADYIAARASGRIEDARAMLVGDELNAWLDDVDARSKGHGLDGAELTTEVISTTDAQMLDELHGFLQQDLESGRVVRVEYPEADAAVRFEEFLVFRTPTSTLQDWAMVRIPFDRAFLALPNPSVDPVGSPDGDRSCENDVECPPR
jgi:hypothetical protein